MADRLISAEKLFQDLKERNIPFNADINEAIIVAPTVDAVEVVRCKDCKRSYGGVWKDDKHLFCKMTNHLMWVDDFCSWAERREDD